MLISTRNVWQDNYCLSLPRMIGSPSAYPASQAKRNRTAQRGEACVILHPNLLRISTPFASLSLSYAEKTFAAQGVFTDQGAGCKVQKSCLSGDQLEGFSRCSYGYPKATGMKGDSGHLTHGYSKAMHL